MFTPKNIQGALEELYDLCDPDYMVDMLVNYSEEFDDISPALLAKSFQKNAEMISEYRVLSSAGEGIDYQGKVLLNSRAVRLLSYVEDMSGDEKVRTIQSKELWLAEDMTFYVVSCMSTITMDKEEAICLNEHRSVVTTVECEDDIFFDMGSLICELDDICLCSATSFLRNWDSILEKKRANLRSISEPARLRQPPPRSTGSAHARGRAQSIREERRIAAPPVLFALLWVRLLSALYGPFCGPLRPFDGCPRGVTPPP